MILMIKTKFNGQNHGSDFRENESLFQSMKSQETSFWGLKSVKISGICNYFIKNAVTLQISHIVQNCVSQR